MKSGAEEKSGLFSRLKSGLSKSAAGLSGLFTKKKLDAATIAELEESLIRSDMGTGPAHALAQAVARNRYDAEIAPGELRAILAREIAALLTKIEKPLAIDAAKKPFVILVAGVNGTGKTTTIGKLARRLSQDGRSVMLAAGDTFRAAAIEQLSVWAKRARAASKRRRPAASRGRMSKRESRVSNPRRKRARASREKRRRSRRRYSCSSMRCRLRPTRRWSTPSARSTPCWRRRRSSIASR